MCKVVIYVPIFLFCVIVDGRTQELHRNNGIENGNLENILGDLNGELENRQFPYLKSFYEFKMNQTLGDKEIKFKSFNNEFEKKITFGENIEFSDGIFTNNQTFNKYYLNGNTLSIYKNLENPSIDFEAYENIVKSDSFQAKYPFLVQRDGEISMVRDVWKANFKLGDPTIQHVVGPLTSGPAILIQNGVFAGHGSVAIPTEINTESNGADATISIPTGQPFAAPPLGLFPGEGIIVLRDHLEMRHDGNYQINPEFLKTDMTIKGPDGKWIPICGRDTKGDPVEDIFSKFGNAPRYTGLIACSGFLAYDQQTFVTAKHCLLNRNQLTDLNDDGSGICLSTTQTKRDELAGVEVDPNHLSELAIIFGYKSNGFEGFFDSFLPSQVRFLSQVKDEFLEQPHDIAVVHLNEPVDSELAQPFEIDDSYISDWQSEAFRKRPLASISHPIGLPMAMDNRDVRVMGVKIEDTIMYVSVDSFQGSSGGPVFDLGTQKVMGMHICGRADYRLIQDSNRPGKKCMLPLATKEPISTNQIVLHVGSLLR